MIHSVAAPYAFGVLQCFVSSCDVQLPVCLSGRQASKLCPNTPGPGGSKDTRTLRYEHGFIMLWSHCQGCVCLATAAPLSAATAPQCRQVPRVQTMADDAKEVAPSEEVEEEEAVVAEGEDAPASEPDGAEQQGEEQQEAEPVADQADGEEYEEGHGADDAADDAEAEADAVEAQEIDGAEADAIDADETAAADMQAAEDEKDGAEQAQPQDQDMAAPVDEV